MRWPARIGLSLAALLWRPAAFADLIGSAEGPTVTTASSAHGPHLVAAEPERRFPLPLSPPLRWAVLGDALHVFATDATGGSAVHMAIAADGRPGAATALPLAPAGVVACRAHLFLTGARLSDQRPIAAVLDASGRVARQIELPIEGAPRRWVDPLCFSDGVVRIMWEVQDAGANWSALEWIDLRGDVAGPQHALRWPDRSSDVAAVAHAGGITLLRLHGQPVQSDLLRVVDGQITERAVLPEPAVTQMVVVEDRCAVLTATARVLTLHWFNSALHAADAPAVLATLAAPHWLSSALLVRVGPQELLVAYATKHPAVQLAPEPTDTEEHRFALYHIPSHSLGPLEDDGDFLAVARIGERIVALRGLTETRIAVYRLVTSG